MKRRAFLKSLAVISVATIPGCKSTPEHFHPPVIGNALVIDKKHFITKDSFTVAYQDSVIKIFKHIDDTYTAMSLNCTHLRCEISETNSGFVCPCHGAKFDATGKLLKGPATKNLLRYNTRVNDENVYIELAQR